MAETGSGEKPEGQEKKRRWGVMAHRDLRLIVGGNTVSQLGFWAQYVAVGWAATSLTSSQFLIALAFSAQFWPSLFVSPFAGLLADRYDRRRLVLYGNLGMVLPPLFAGMLIQAGDMTLWLLIVLVLLGGVGQALTQPATVAFIPALVPAQDVPSAVAANSALTSSTRVIGPTIAGVVIAAWGVSWGFYVNAISFFAVSIACVMVKARPARSAAHQASKLAELRDGFDYTRGHRAVAWLTVFMGVIGFCFMQAALMPIISRQVLHGTVSTYGLLSAAPGLGFVLGAIAIPFVFASGSRQRAAIVVCGVGIGCALLAVGISRSIPITAAALALFGFSQFILMTTSTAILVSVTDDAFRGRVMGLYLTVTIGIIPLNSVLAGVLASALGAPLTVGLCGMVALAASGLFWARRGLTVVREGTAAHEASVALD